MSPAPTPAPHASSHDGAGPAAARRMTHPGPADGPRRQHLAQPSRPALRFSLRPGVALQDGLLQAARRTQAPCAAFSLLAGGFARVRYWTAGPDAEGGRVATYVGETTLAAPQRLVCGAGTIGTGLDGAPLIHCHAAFADANGALAGGHLVPIDAVIGWEGLQGLLWGFDAIALSQRDDAETGHSIFKPEERTAP
ncbi:MAG: DNA-binding protein [Alphaproteobacteria bacterium]|nr:DNA-binding protein [Alphaproteobacteria bacterium]